MKRQKWVLAFAGAAAALAAIYFGWGKLHSPAAVPSADAFVDPAVCATCHQEIEMTYRLTGMGRALYRPAAANTVEDYKKHNTYYHAASDRYYEMFERDGKPYQRRYQVGYGGARTNVVETSVDYVIGSGNHARSYLHRTAEGKLVELPVSWYAEKGGYWAMSPGYDRPGQQDFRRAIYDCMFCHTSYSALQHPQNAAISELVFPETLSEGIDCQRCHGPGRAHVEAAGSGKSSPEAIRRAILNPARLSRDRQMEVCMQCHLETTSRPLPNMIRRYEHPAFTYTPDKPLVDYFDYFDHAPGTGYEEKFEVAGAAYRFRKSACFRSSGITCTTCHNPHDIPRGGQAETHYNSVCRNCHQQAHAQQAAAHTDCVNCHMPKRRTEDAVHVVMTDHYIQRNMPAGDLLAPVDEAQEVAKGPYRGEVKLYYPTQVTDTPENELYLAVAQVQNGSNLQAGIPRLSADIQKYKPGQAEFYNELGQAYAKAGNQQEAIHWFEQALEKDPGFRPARNQLGAALLAAGDLSRAIEVLGKAAAASHDPSVLTNLGNAYLRQGENDKAAQALQQALAIDPVLPEAQNLLGMAWSRKGDLAAAEKSFRAAITAQPDFAEAHNNLAGLLVGARDLKQAEYHFQKAVALNPDYAEAHQGYALLLILMQAYPKATSELEQAVRLDPNLADAHSSLADLYSAQGKMDRAAGEYRAALRVSPGLAEANYGLGRALASQGRIPEAEQQFRLAVQNNPNYYEAHLALGMVLARTGSAAEARAHLQKAAESGDPALRQAAINALR
jgi:Tfp pilus assembly protein PilF